MRACDVNPTPADLGEVTSVLYELEHSCKPSLPVLKGPDNTFCHVRKLPPNKFQMRLIGQGIVFHKHDKRFLFIINPLFFPRLPSLISKRCNQDQLGEIFGTICIHVLIQLGESYILNNVWKFITKHFYPIWKKLILE